MDSHLTIANESSWLRLKQHLSESFSGELIYQRRAYDVARVDELLDKRRRNAYRYILLLLAVILLPIGAHNLYVGELVPAIGGMLLLGILMANILLLSMNREAFLSPPLVLVLSISLLLLSIYYGQSYSLYLLYPLLVALPVLLKTRWAVLLGVLSGLLVAPLVFTQYDATTALVIGLSLGLTWLVSAWLVFAVTEQSRRLEDAEKVANKLRAAVEGERILPEGSLTISVGVAGLTGAGDLDQWLNMADTAMYLAKKNGRNRVEVAEPAQLPLGPLAKTVPDWR